MKRSFIREILESIDSEIISFAGGLPDEKLFPIEDLKKANIGFYDDAKNLQYSTSIGITPLREKIANFYNEDGFETNTENILITTGSQQALYIIAKYFENSKIVIEEPSYLGAVNIFKMNSLKMHPIELMNDGIDIDKFKDEFTRTKLAYLIPDFQNPKTSQYSNAKREYISKIVLNNGGYIIEDSPYSELYFSAKRRSISSMISDNSLHLGSFSKTLSPSLRIGWVRANNSIIKEFVKIKEIIDLHSCTIAQYTLNNYLENNFKYKNHLQTLRDLYKVKMENFALMLKKYLPEFIFSKPNGGMFIFGFIKGIDTFELVQECIKQKVVFVPANQFYLDKKISNEIRFNFTHSSALDVEKGLKKINIVLAKMSPTN